MSRNPALFLAVACAGLALFLNFTSVSGKSASAVAAEPASKSAPEAVEDDMHEFMEYVFQPAYNRLKAAMASEPKENAGWKTIKSDGLILAEGGNLLLIRESGGDEKTWNELSVAVREAGGKLYRAAKKKDYATSKQHYTSMLNKCNECHQKFADGKHQLDP